MTILAIGDLVGANGLKFLQNHLPAVKKFYGVDLTIANAENLAHGRGMDTAGIENAIMCGVDVLTGGNHSFGRSEAYRIMDDCPALLRPANYPSTNPGKGWCIISVKGKRSLIINLLGSVFIECPESPFATVDRLLRDQSGKYDFAVVDIHAEATSEKIALGKYLDGRAAVVFGTHTHVQTADEKILPKGTGYITDLGMTGPVDSILGVKNEIIIKHFLDYLPSRFEVADGPCSMEGAVFVLDDKTLTCTAVERIRVD